MNSEYAYKEFSILELYIRQKTKAKQLLTLFQDSKIHVSTQIKMTIKDQKLSFVEFLKIGSKFELNIKES